MTVLSLIYGWISCCKFFKVRMRVATFFSSSKCRKSLQCVILPFKSFDWIEMPVDKSSDKALRFTKEQSLYSVGINLTLWWYSFFWHVKSLSFYSFANFKKDCLALCIGIAFFQTTRTGSGQIWKIFLFNWSWQL